MLLCAVYSHSLMFQLSVCCFALKKMFKKRRKTFLPQEEQSGQWCDIYTFQWNLLYPSSVEQECRLKLDPGPAVVMIILPPRGAHTHSEDHDASHTRRVLGRQISPHSVIYTNQEQRHPGWKERNDIHGQTERTEKSWGSHSLTVNYLILVYVHWLDNKGPLYRRITNGLYYVQLVKMQPK